MTPTAQEIFVEATLYKEFNVINADKKAVEKLLYGSSSIKCHCANCADDSVFVSESELKERPESEVRIVGTRTPPMYNDSYRQHIAEINAKPLEMDVQQIIEFNCAKCRIHRLLFVVQIGNGVLQKIGQLPSYADINHNEVNKYKGVLDNEMLSEFKRAIGLYSHGIGVGSFVYLRRIVEKYILNPAYETAKSTPEWDDQKYERARVVEKIKLLEKQLPPAMVECRQVYGILSKGIHELAEDECKKYFPVVKNVIELVLDELKANKEKENKLKEMKKELGKITGEINESN